MSDLANMVSNRLVASPKAFENIDNKSREKNRKKRIKNTSDFKSWET